MAAVGLSSSVRPKQHPDCCMAISQTLLKTLAAFLPAAPATVLSIGSGTGLLEALLLDHVAYSLDIRGVEVSPTVNKFIAEENMFFVNGTWDLCEHASLAHAWIFVYPRDPKLLASYIRLHAHEQLSRIIWLGPRMDWQDYEKIFQASDYNQLTVVEDCGATEYEIVAVAQSIKPSDRSQRSR